ncbi:MAG: carboxylesterase family protein [Bacteroidales bacterium]|nr:carboxylesterase family protein [Bacteroidales bacterium]
MKNSLLTNMVCAIAMVACNQPAETNPVLSIEGGQVQGIVSNNSIVYKGVPYAAPPVGDLRWRAPQPVEKWEGVMVCDHFLNAAPQAAHDPNDGNYGTEFFAEDAPFSEDCLHLNIWVPKDVAGKSDSKLPVALWIHGGAYSAGWSFEPEMDGEAWAERGVILVTANYRLGVFGYLSHPLLTAESGFSGNYGLMDQIAALKWIKRNIVQFGGDPDKVMIFGQSAGGGSIRCMIMSPESRGLISGAVVMSAGGLNGRLTEGAGQETADALGKDIMDMGGFTTLEQMRAASYEELQEALNKYAMEKKVWLSLTPHVDGKVLVESFDSAAYNNHLADVPLMFGSVADDMAGLDNGFQELANLRDSLGNKPTYIYRFDASAPEDGRPCLHGSFHSSELWYVFRTLKRSWRPYTEVDEELSNRMVDYWTNMAKYGNPNYDGSGEWKASTTTQPYVQPLERR